MGRLRVPGLVQLGAKGLLVTGEPLPFDPVGGFTLVQESRVYVPPAKWNVARLAAASGLKRPDISIVPPNPAVPLSWDPDFPPFVRRSAVDIARYPSLAYVRKPFAPADLTSNWWFRAAYAGGGASWAGTASAGTSGSLSLVAFGTPGTSNLNALAGASLDGVDDRFVALGDSLSSAVGNSATQSCWGWVLFRASAAFTDPGTDAGRLINPAFFTDANEVFNVGYSNAGCTLAVRNSDASATSIAVAANINNVHLMLWRAVDQTSLEIAVDGLSFTTQAWTKSLSTSRAGATRIGVRGSTAANFLTAVVWEDNVLSGTASPATMADVVSYINQRYALSF